VRYEDLQADPIAVFTGVVRFCGLDDDAVQIARAVDFSRFERVQQQEAEHGFDEKMARAASFFRKGTSGSWREALTPELVARLIADQQEAMRRFGYLSAEGDPVF
jgi:hypothetical protein